MSPNVVVIAVVIVVLLRPEFLRLIARQVVMVEDKGEEPIRVGTAFGVGQTFDSFQNLI